MRGTDRTLLLLLGGLALVALVGRPIIGWTLGPVWAGRGMMWGQGFMHPPFAGDGWPWGVAMVLGGLTMLAFWGALVVGIVLVVRAVTRRDSASERPGPEGEGSALDVLKRRYAAGEITQAEYTEMRGVLEQ